MIKFGTCKVCCFCSDKRTNEDIQSEPFYIDGIGDIDIKIPRDMFYCPKCKVGRMSSAEFYNKISKLIKNRQKLLKNN